MSRFFARVVFAVFAVAGVLALSGCFMHGVARVTAPLAIERDLPSPPNPVVWEFSATPAEIRAILRSAYGQRLIQPGESAEQWKIRAEALGRLASPEGRNDSILALWPTETPAYRVDGETLPYFTDLYIRITPVAHRRTRVEVSAIRAHVHLVATGPFVNPHNILGVITTTGVRHEVEPTTIEEYRVLRYIGSAFGETEMPPLRLSGDG